MNSLEKITIVLISYFSYKKIKIFIKKIPKNVCILVLENSNDKKIKKLSNRKNLRVIYKQNDGYGSSINYASKIIKTKYFLVVQPDIKGIDKKALLNFYNYGEKLNGNFSVIGPHFLNASKKGHFQTNIKLKIKEINNVHGSVMFFNLKNFKKLNGFDKKIFLYWEETDFTKRAWEKKIPVYQLNKVRVFHEKGLSVELSKNIKSNDIKYLYIWHFIWSKYYFYKKHYGTVRSLIYFIPVILRCLIKILYYKNMNLDKFHKYHCRLNGLISSIIGKKSYFRLNNIKKIY